MVVYIAVFNAVFNCTAINSVINLVNLFKLFVCCSAVELAEAITKFSQKTLNYCGNFLLKAKC